MFSLRNSALVLTILLTEMQVANAGRLEVRPNFVYLYRNDYSRIFKTYKEPYEIAKAEISKPDPGTGRSAWRALGATPSGITYSGHPVLDVRLAHLTDTGAIDYTYTNGGYVTTLPQCPVGFTMEWDPAGTFHRRIVTCVTYAREEPCDTCDAVGNPVLPSVGIKLQEEVDYSGEGEDALKFVRTYRSDRNGWEHNHQMTGTDLRMYPQKELVGVFDPPPEDPHPGPNCYNGRGEYTGDLTCFAPMPTGAANDFALRRGNGSLLKFGSGQGFAPASHINDRWTPVYINGVKVANEIYNAANDTTERYALDGLIDQITFSNGRVTRYEYQPFDGVKTPSAPEWVIKSVTNGFGRKLSFTYGLNGRVETMMTPSNQVYTYRYGEASGGANGSDNLTSVTYPDDRKRVYWYNEPEHTENSHQPFALTGITDENGVRYATFKYSRSGAALS